MTNVFAYGSLMYKEVMFKLIKRQDYKSEPGVLFDYSRRSVKGKPYPGIMYQKGNKVQGIIYYQLDEQDIKVLHLFEGEEYKAIQVDVQVSNIQQKATVYLYANPLNLTENFWNQKQFEQKHLESFAHDHCSGNI